MEETKVKFDIGYWEQIESGEYEVRTRKGNPVRIVDWNYCTPDRHLLAVVEDDEGQEWAASYTPDGCYYDDKEESEYDLFVIMPAPDKPLTELEDAVYRCISAYDPEIMDDEGMLDAAREEAKDILKLASEELKPKYDNTKVDEELIDRMVNEKREASPFILGLSMYRCGLEDMYKRFADELTDAHKNADEIHYDKGYDDGVDYVITRILERLKGDEITEPVMYKFFFKNYKTPIDV
jgi:hypothetical protein